MEWYERPYSELLLNVRSQMMEVEGFLVYCGPPINETLWETTRAMIEEIEV